MWQFIVLVLVHQGILTAALLTHAPTLSGGVAMDSVSHPPNVVMGTGSAQMAVMNSSAILHVVGGHATMDSVSHPTSIVMDTASAQMAVMNSAVL